MKPGKVYLVGAGPGDPGLVTRRALECLARAEVVVYDRLLNEGLLDTAPVAAERIYAGKAASDHALPQQEINQLLVRKAREGKTVVRLKGGDPFVFGRGGEEAGTLREHGIPFEIVPGITSAIAVPAYAGIPVTHRGVASSFAVITGHEDPTKSDTSIRWDKISTATDTLVFLMGMENLAEIAGKLRRHGRPLHTPVAVIRNGTHPDQQTVTGTLDDIVKKVKAAAIGPPAIIVVGEVVGLRERLRWFDNRPLTGKRVLVTRARHQASALSELLAERGAIPVELPAIDIQPVEDSTALDRALSDLPHYQWVVFASVNAVEAFFARLRRLGWDARALHAARVAAIGPATAQALQEKGITPDYTPADYSTEGILAGLKGTPLAGARVLLPRTDIADATLAEGLARLGAVVHEVKVYRTVPATAAIARAKDLLQAGEIDVVTFASSSTVTNLVTAYGGDVKLNGTLVACIGPKTAETAVKAGLRVDITPAEYTIPAFAAAIEDYFRKEGQ